MDRSIFQTYHAKYYRELMDDCIPFWMNNSIDPENGGIYNSLTREGKVFSRDKSVWLQGRCAWIFTQLCKQYGIRSEWKAMAESTLQFITKHCIDPKDGRMYFSVTAEGLPLRKRRYYFSEAFYTMACIEYGALFDDPFYREQGKKYYSFMMDIYRDPSCDPYKITPKMCPGTRESVAFSPAMILLNVSHIMEDCDPENAELYRKNAAELTNAILTTFIKPDLKALLEVTSPNGEFQKDVTGGRTMNPGHTIEGAWFLINQAQRTHDASLLSTAEDIYSWALDIGWDKEYGGILAFVDVLGYPPEALEHDMKLWWPTCELLITSLMLYQQTGNEAYWDWFVKADAYADKHFRDPSYGEWFGYLNRRGEPTMPACKGCLFKGPFHVPRMLIMVERMLSQLAEEPS